MGVRGWEAANVEDKLERLLRIPTLTTTAGAHELSTEIAKCTEKQFRCVLTEYQRRRVPP